MKTSLQFLFLSLFILLTCSNKNIDKNTYGIDISRYQGEIDWKNVKKWEDHKIEFVYIKATEGATLVDNTYRTNLEGAKENNLLVGSYHFFRANTPAKLQYQNFTSVVDRAEQDIIPIIDVEVMDGCSSKEFHKNFSTFLKLLENHFGKKPMIYTSNSFYNKHIALRYKGYRYFIGRYSTYKPFLADGHDWTIWQFTETGKVNGISKNVDIDIMNEKFKLSVIMMP